MEGLCLSPSPPASRHLLGEGYHRLAIDVWQGVVRQLAAQSNTLAVWQLNVVVMDVKASWRVVYEEWEAASISTNVCAMAER